jgi:hypothetical protein
MFRNPKRFVPACHNLSSEHVKRTPRTVAITSCADIYCILLTAAVGANLIRLVSFSRCSFPRYQ